MNTVQKIETEIRRSVREQYGVPFDSMSLFIESKTRFQIERDGDPLDIIWVELESDA